jgi:hypothetical protein
MISKPVAISQLPPERITFTAYFDDFVPAGTEFLLVRLYDLKTEHGQQIVEVERHFDFDITGHSPLGPDATLVASQTLNEKITVQVSSLGWPAGIKPDDKITLTALPRRGRLIYVAGVRRLQLRQLVK